MFTEHCVFDRILTVSHFGNPVDQTEARLVPVTLLAISVRFLRTAVFPGRFTGST